LASPLGGFRSGVYETEGAALLHAGQHARHAAGALQASVVRFDQVLLAPAFGRCQDGDALLVGNASHPGPVRRGALIEHGRLDAVDTNDVVEEVDQVLRTL
jgi:hypothetical protein